MEENSKVAEVLRSSPLGPEVIVVFGGSGAGGGGTFTAKGRAAGVASRLPHQANFRFK